MLPYLARAHGGQNTRNKYVIFLIVFGFIKSAALVVFAPRSDPSTDQTSVQAGRSSDGSQCAHREKLSLWDKHTGAANRVFFLAHGRSAPLSSACHPIRSQKDHAILQYVRAKLQQR
jgi:hypothetical protein